MVSRNPRTLPAAQQSAAREEVKLWSPEECSRKSWPLPLPSRQDSVDAVDLLIRVNCTTLYAAICTLRAIQNRIPMDNYCYYYTLSCQKVCRQAAVKAAKILPLDGLARSKQDPINRGHGAQYIYPCGCHQIMIL